MAAQLEPGSLVDGFHLHERLHQGGMATLWRVTRTDIDLPLVMKVPFTGWGEATGAIVSFEVEQMILPRLSGPHVPRFVAAAFSEQPYLVMERIEGSSLDDLLAGPRRPHAEVAALGARVAAALHDIHRQHVIHLDVKPGNVMLRDSGEAVMIDFGLSRHDRLPDLLAEETRLPIGTASYIAPEQILGERGDPRSDLFALGAVMYLAVTGQHPFGIPETPGGMRARLYRDPAPPRALDPECPPWLQEIILRCLEVEPDARYQTGAQLALDLQYPDQVRLTDRAERQRRDRLPVVARRWLKTRQAPTPRAGSVSGQLAQAPIIMVAVDLAPEFASLAESLRIAVWRILAIEPAARLTCVNVLRTPLIAIDSPDGSGGRNLYLQRLIELKAWARPLGVLEDRIGFHVLEALDAAAALVDYARRNQVDHVVIGARGNSTLRRFLGSVSSHVVAEAPCSVTVVRVPGRAERREVWSSGTPPESSPAPDAS